MNKTDLIAALSTEGNLARPEAARVVDLLFDPETGILAKALKRGERIQVSGFGTFETRKRAGRTGRNPRSGEEISIPPSISAAFRPGKALKDVLAG